ncbi:MAG: hypothetical protein R3C10_12335 [Pirellulales bacterium]
MSSKMWCAVFGCAVVLADATLVVAQQSGGAAPSGIAAAPTNTPPAGTEPAAPAFTSEQQAAREKVLTSDEWRRVGDEFHQWLSVQSVYSAEQVAQIKAQMQRQVNGMTAEQLEQFVTDLDSKLKVLMSPEMVQTRSWLAQYYTPQYREKLAKRFGVQDPLNMTAAQLTEALDRFEDERSSRNTAQADFNRTRQQEVAAQLAQQRADTAAAEQARASASRSASSPYASPYAPQRVKQPYYLPYERQPNYSIGPWGGVWISGY